jgi:hypothetical protein
MHDQELVIVITPTYWAYYRDGKMAAIPGMGKPDLSRLPAGTVTWDVAEQKLPELLVDVVRQVREDALSACS